MKPKISVTGIKEIDSVLRELPLSLTDKVLQNAAAIASKPLVTKEKLLAPEGPTGNLVDSIGVVKGNFKQVQSTQREVGAVVVGPRRGKFKGNAAHLVEYGTKPRYTKGTGKKRKVKNAFRGVMPKKPFVAPAFSATKNEVLAGYKEQVGKSLLRTMKKAIKNK